jgi:hypothetical protein
MSSTQARSLVRTNGRSTVRLGRNLEKHLLAYAAAASAGLLSTAPPAEAEIIYTPSNTPVTIAKVNQGPVLTPLDLTNQGVPEFGIVMSSGKAFSYYGSTTQFKFLLKVVPGQAGNSAVQGSQAPTAGALSAGVTVGAKDKFVAGDAYMQIKSYTRTAKRSSGTWQKVEFAYVGLKFLINGQVHYGWARVKFPSVGATGYPSIYGYAYESVPNRPIVTGQTSGTAQAAAAASTPATLGLLAAGASGVKERRAATPAAPRENDLR